ncbi:hypothetical protein LIER_12593 [Lithospermum erythrorhizon]|uniref:Transmembrane protein n=1 Tax=Lithospermum erythrorhizon TaxID=34254 RepID=A0AAV3PUT4_LITER
MATPPPPPLTLSPEDKEKAEIAVSFFFLAFLALMVILLEDEQRRDATCRAIVDDIARYNTSLEQLNIYNINVSENTFQGSCNLSIKLANDHKFDISTRKGVVSISFQENVLLWVTSFDPIYLPVNQSKTIDLSLNQTTSTDSYFVPTFLYNRNLKNSTSFSVQAMMEVTQEKKSNTLVVTCGGVNMVFTDPTSLYGGPLKCTTAFDGSTRDRYDTC